MAEKYKNRRGMVTWAIVVGNVIAWLINIAAGGGSFWGRFLYGGGYAKQFGEATFQAIVMHGVWWRLMTCGYLHIGIFHLGFNLHAMIMVVGKMESCLGSFKTFVGYHLGTVITAFFWCLLFRNGSMVGASLGIYVAMGVLLASNKIDASKRYMKFSRAECNYLVAYVIGGCFLGIGTITVHLIGLVVGGMLGYCYSSEKNN